MIKIEQQRVSVSVVQDGTTVQVGPQITQPLVAPQVLEVRVSPAGARGVRGQSAYESWLAAGNTGTEADFLAAMIAGGLTEAEVLELIEEDSEGGLPNPALVFANALI